MVVDLPALEWPMKRSPFPFTTAAAECMRTALRSARSGPSQIWSVGKRERECQPSVPIRAPSRGGL